MRSLLPVFFVTAFLVTGCMPVLVLSEQLKDALSPVALSHPRLDSSAWHVISDIGFTDESGIFARNFNGHLVSRSIADGRVVEVDASGAIGLYDLRTGELIDTRDIGAVGSAWANDRQRIAVVTREAMLPADVAHELIILNNDLIPQDRFTLDLPLPDASSDYRTLVVSWRDDDTQIAVSTDATPRDCIPSVVNASVVARCLVVTVGDGAQSRYQLTNVYFLDGDWVVGTVPDSAVVDTSTALGNVYAMRLDNGDVADRLRIIGSELAVASYSPDGVFVSAETSVLLGPDCERGLYLRSRLARSARVGSSVLGGSPVSVFRPAE